MGFILHKANAAIFQLVEITKKVLMINCSISKTIVVDIT